MSDEINSHSDSFCSFQLILLIFPPIITEAMSRAAFLTLPGLLQEKVEDIFVPPELADEVNKILIFFEKDILSLSKLRRNSMPGYVKDKPMNPIHKNTSQIWTCQC